MNDASRSASRLIETLAHTSERFIAAAQQLRTQPGVAEVRRGTDIRQCASGTCVEFFVEAELEGDAAMVWWLDALWSGERWTICASVSRQSAGAKAPVRELRERVATSVDGLRTELDACATELLESTKLDELLPAGA